MNTGPTDFRGGYTTYKDEQKTNGTGLGGRTNGAEKPSALNSHAEGHSWTDPDLSILDDRRGDLPDFPIDTLTEQWQRWLERAAHGAGVTAAHVVVPLLGVV